MFAKTFFEYTTSKKEKRPSKFLRILRIIHARVNLSPSLSLSLSLSLFLIPGISRAKIIRRRAPTKARRLRLLERRDSKETREEEECTDDGMPVCTLCRMLGNGQGLKRAGWIHTPVRTLGHVHTSPHRKVSEQEKRSMETETKWTEGERTRGGGAKKREKETEGDRRKEGWRRERKQRRVCTCVWRSVSAGCIGGCANLHAFCSRCNKRCERKVGRGCRT